MYKTYQEDLQIPVSPCIGPETTLTKCTLVIRPRDERARKSYGLEVRVNFTLQHDMVGHAAHRNGPRSYRNCPHHPVLSLMTKTAGADNPLPGITGSASADTPFLRTLKTAPFFLRDGGYYAREQGLTLIVAEQYIPFDKPSAIIDPALLVEPVKLSGIVAEVLKLCSANIQKNLEDTAREERATHATILARRLANTADKNAREVTRYEQRLAALHAELQAERTVQLKITTDALLAEIGSAPRFTDGAPIDQRSVDAAVKHAPDFFSPIDPSGFGFTEKVIKPENVQ